MHSLRILALLVFAVAVFGTAPARAEDKSVVLPTSTQVEKIGPGVFVFVLPDGQRLEVRRLDPRTGILGDCGLRDRNGKALAAGRSGKLTAGPKPTGKQTQDPLHFVKIDGEVVWLPATLRFQSKTRPPDPFEKSGHMPVDPLE